MFDYLNWWTMFSRMSGEILSFRTVTINHAVRMRYMEIFVSSLFHCLYWYNFRVATTQLQSSMYSRWLSNRNNQTKPSTMLASTKHYKPHCRFITVNQMKIVCIFLKDNVQEGMFKMGRLQVCSWDYKMGKVKFLFI